jgi:hypothetical protein
MKEPGLKKGVEKATPITAAKIGQGVRSGYRCPEYTFFGGAIMTTLFTKTAHIGLVVLVCLMGCSSDKTKSENKSNNVKRNLPISAEQASMIAVAEVKNRDGWNGEADLAFRNADGWLVNVWAIPKKPGGFVAVTIGEDGKILSFEAGH